MQGLLSDLGITQRVDELFINFLIGKTPKRGDRKIKIEYSQFQKWLKRYCKVFTTSQRTVYRIVERLEKAGVIEVHFRGVGGAFVQLQLFFTAECQPASNLTDVQNQQNQYDSDAETDTDNYTPEALIKQQQLIEIKRMCTKVGINYRLSKDWYEVLSYGVEKVRDTLQVFHYRNLTGEIRNPCGWFRKALRDDYCVDVSTSAFDSKAFWRRLQDSYYWIKGQCEQTFGYIPFDEMQTEPMPIKIGGVKEPHHLEIL